MEFNWTLSAIEDPRCTFDQAKSLYRKGAVTPQQWEAYCYKWRTGAPRFSNIGLREANEHAKRNGLPLLPNMND